MCHPKQTIWPEISTAGNNNAGEGLEVHIKSPWEGKEIAKDNSTEPMINESTNKKVDASKTKTKPKTTTNPEHWTMRPKIGMSKSGVSIMSWSGHTVRSPVILQGAWGYYSKAMDKWNKKVAFVRARIGGHFKNSSVLHIMKLNEAIASEEDAKLWRKMPRRNTTRW